LNGFIENAKNSGFILKGITYSPVKGPKGNIEYLGWLGTQGQSMIEDTGEIVSRSHIELG